MEVEMKRLCIALLALTVVGVVYSAQVNIGTTNALPGQFAQCQTLMAGIDVLADDPTNPVLNAALGDLAAGTTTMIQFEDTTLPGALCTGANVCVNAAITTCDKKSLSASNARVLPDSNGTLIACEFFCVEPLDPSAVQYWVRVGCP